VTAWNEGSGAAKSLKFAMMVIASRQPLRSDIIAGFRKAAIPKESSFFQPKLTLFSSDEVSRKLHNRYIAKGFFNTQPLQRGI
jgi:hypothetical protein